MKWNDYDPNKNAFPETIKIIADWLWFVSTRWNSITDKNKFIEQNLQPLITGTFRDPKVKNGQLSFPSPALGTLIRHLGFIDDDFNVSELLKFVAEGKITLSEYSLVILSKHRGWIDEEPKVNFLVLLCLYLRRNNYCDVSEEMLETLSRVDGYSLNPTDSDDENRNDLLYNYIKGTGLFEEINKRGQKRHLKLVSGANEIVDFIADNQNVITVDPSTSKNDRYRYYGDTVNGIFKLKGLVLPSSWSSFYPNLLNANRNNRQLTNPQLPLQKIFYGAPGTGKSHKIKDDESVKAADERNLVFRTTFHPDSDYSTFVGAYKPTMRPVPNQYKAVAGKDEEITYSFVPQAFLQAYVAAWNNPDDKVFLVIEEINRGNCAQIFGDLFQLLDRDGNGWSEYPIMADKDLAKYLNGNDEAGLPVLNNKDGIKDGKLCLPKNLYIWATMNTSDQSLFPIDSAFKRRWDWEYMPIGYKNTNWTIEIGEKKYKWIDFQRKINDKIYSVDNSEDKQLGDYFVNADRTNNVISSDTLLNKILFYLWNDVCKDDPEQIFRWKDDQDNDKEKGIKFSEFFCVEKERKLQGFMAFLKIDAIDEGEGTNESNDDNSDKDGKEFSYNGTVASMREIAASVVSDYAKTNSGMNAQQVRDYFIETFKGIGIAHIVETESEYRQRDGQSSQQRSATPVTIPNGENIYVSTQWRAGKESDNFNQFMKIVNEKGLGAINSL